MPFQLSKSEDTRFASHEEHKKPGLGMTAIWEIGIVFTGLYTLIVYILPLIGLFNQLKIPLKMFVEMIICFNPIVTGLVLSIRKIQHQSPLIHVENEVLIVQLDDYMIGTCCLDIVSVSGSVYLDENGKPRYNETMLLAMRAGMDKSVTMAFEAGVSNREPFLHIFITAMATSLTKIQETLRREATRTEAILLSSLNNVELKLLEENTLLDVALTFLDDTYIKSQELITKERTRPLHLVTLKGLPRIYPTQETSQIGTFISTALRQGYTTSVTCVFSSKCG